VNRAFLGKVSIFLTTIALLAASMVMAPSASANIVPPKGATVVTDPLGPRAISPGCQGANIIVVGTRGSGEVMTDGSIYGFGNPASQAAEGIRRQFTSATKIRFLHVPYTAASVKDALLAIDEGLAGLPSPYIPSLKAGVELTRGVLKTVAEKCPAARVVLVGYSQGAHVMHLIAATPPSLPAKGQQEQIAGVYLIADPIRDGRDPAMHYYGSGGISPYSAVTVNGIPYSSKGGLHGTIDPVTAKPVPIMPATLKGKVIHHCVANDPVCNRGAVRLFGAHSTAYHTASLAGLPSLWMAARATEALKAANGGVWNPQLGATIVTDGAPAAITTKCEADIAIIGSRGSEELATSGSIPGFGASASVAAHELAKRIPKSTKVRFMPVLVPLETPKSISMTGDYFSAMSARTDRSLALARNLLRICPGTKIVTLGYAMGAQSWHTALPKLTAAERARVSGVWLIADPQRNNADAAPVAKPGRPTVLQFGGYSAFKASSAYAPAGSHWAGVKLPVDLAGIVVSSCDLKDFNCNSVSSGTPASYLEGVRIHREAYKSVPVYNEFPSTYLASQIAYRR
jgi:hypothetical protein